MSIGAPRVTEDGEVTGEDYDSAWGKEIARRIKEVDDGTVKAMTREEALRFIASDDPADDPR